MKIQKFNELTLKRRARVVKTQKPMLLGAKIFIALFFIVLVINPLFEVIFGRTELAQSLLGLVMLIIIIIVTIKHYRQKKEYQKSLK